MMRQEELRALFERGIERQRAGDPSGAITAYEQVLRGVRGTNPMIEVELQRLVGNCLHEMGRLVEAQERR